jgi:two-component system, chemotaxis family, chemotaxis protein CheY
MTQTGPRVLDVGNCDPDHGSVCRLLSTFDAKVDRVMYVDEAIAQLSCETYDLVLVNRLIFADSSDALPLVDRMRADDGLRSTPVMMISNFDDAQDRAVAAGAVRGFGKAQLNDDATIELLATYLRKTAANQ